MTNTVINTTSIRTVQSSKVIRQAMDEIIVAKLIGPPGDDNSIIYQPLSKFEKGGYVMVPTRRVDTGAALAAGADYERTGTRIPYSASQITLAERGRPFRDAGKYETNQAVINTREQITLDMKNWYASEWDKFLIDALIVTTPAATLPAAAGMADSSYNVDYVGDASDWAGLGAEHQITAQSISRAKRVAQKRGIRKAKLPNGAMGYVMFLPIEATFALKLDTEFMQQAQFAMPRSEQHMFFTGNGPFPWAVYDGVFLIEDLRASFGGDDTTFLHVEDMTPSPFIKFEGLLLGAQAIAYYKQEGPNYWEEIRNHGREFEASVVVYDGVCKPQINFGAINTSTSVRDVGVLYFCGTAPRIY